LARVFLNVINNAFYALNQKKKQQGESYIPTISVSTASEQNSVKIKIRDNGGGMTKEVLSKVFTPFFTTKPTGTGIGLGLSISYDIIVQEHGGEIRVDSEEGSFTEVTILLPKKLAPKVAANV